MSENQKSMSISEIQDYIARPMDANLKLILSALCDHIIQLIIENRATDASLLIANRDRDSIFSQIKVLDERVNAINLDRQEKDNRLEKMINHESASVDQMVGTIKEQLESKITSLDNSVKVDLHALRDHSDRYTYTADKEISNKLHALDLKVDELARLAHCSHSYAVRNIADILGAQINASESVKEKASAQEDNPTTRKLKLEIFRLQIALLEKEAELEQLAKSCGAT